MSDDLPVVRLSEETIDSIVEDLKKDPPCEHREELLEYLETRGEKGDGLSLGVLIPIPSGAIALGYDIRGSKPEDSDRSKISARGGARYGFVEEDGKCYIVYQSLSGVIKKKPVNRHWCR